MIMMAPMCECGLMIDIVAVTNNRAIVAIAVPEII